MTHVATASGTANLITEVGEFAKDSHPSRFTYPRLFCTEDGVSHFEDVTVDLKETNFAPPAPPVYIGGQITASSTFFGGFEPGWGTHDLETHVYHAAPAPQFIIILRGEFSVTAMDGESRLFQPGDVFRLEDTAPNRGHISVVGDKPGVFMFVR